MADRDLPPCRHLALSAWASGTVNFYRWQLRIFPGTYKHEVARPFNSGSLRPGLSLSPSSPPPPVSTLTGALRQLTLLCFSFPTNRTPSNHPHTTTPAMLTLSYLSSRSSLVLALSFARTVRSGFTRYKRELSIVGSDFFEQFNWESKNDPTHGRVSYLTLEEARAKNLTYGSSPFLSLVIHG